MHRVASGGMRGTELQHPRGGQRIAAAPQADPRLRGPTQGIPNILCGNIISNMTHISARKGESLTAISRSPPSRSSMPMRSSQSLNSGAGRRPKVRRANSASWKDRL
ncbi:Uncharacterised protein [Mycobacteroides abscessus subsp. abscessus]|nr:Uncharacterised protein [Mycobacteroides abscessus subsp. abscessus]